MPLIADGAAVAGFCAVLRMAGFATDPFGNGNEDDASEPGREGDAV